jgi:hypothetical protein
MASGVVNATQSPNILKQIFGERWLKAAILKAIDADRFATMTEAGKHIKDAPEVAGLSAAKMAAGIGMRDSACLEEV